MTPGPPIIGREEDPNSRRSSELNVDFSFELLDGRVVRFKGLSDPSDGAYTWDWAFGDGDTSTEESPTHSYSTNGEYTVKLTVSSWAEGVQEPITKSITKQVTIDVEEFLEAKFSYTLNGKVVEFKDESEPASDIASWSWDLDNGDISSDKNPIHNFSIYGAGEYEVSLTVSSEDGITSTYSQTISIDKVDLTTGPAEPPEPPGPPPPPALVARFSFQKEGETVHFRNESMPIDEILTYTWEFGDGKMSIDQDPVHQFEPGLYTVKLSVTDLSGQTSSTSDTLRIPKQGGSVGDPPPEIVLPDAPTFFISGLTGSGKTVLLASLLYYIKRFRSDLRVKLLTEVDSDNNEAGYKLFQSLYGLMSNGVYPESTSELEFPTMHLELSFQDRSNDPVDFLISDMAGENWKLGLDNDGQIKDLSPELRNFILSSHESEFPLGFIFIIPANETETDHFQNIDNILTLLEKEELEDCDMLFVITKWDLVKDDYVDAEEFLEQQSSSVYTLMHHFDNARYTTFTIGKDIGQSPDDPDKYLFSAVDYDTGSPEELLHWLLSVIFETDMGPSSSGGGFWSTMKGWFGLN
jgi:PKD repeat protein